MATIASRQSAHPRAHHVNELTPQLASRYAWFTWLALLLAPFLVFMFVAYRLMDEMAAPRNQEGSNAWFLGTMAYLAVFAPLAILYRSRCFSNYYKGQCVAPRDYLRGSLAVWLTLEVGGILALVGCLMMNSLLPCLIPALVAFMFFVPFWPSGTAMVRPTGHHEDTGRYEEPR